jgi:uncharacterized protein
MLSSLAFSLVVFGIAQPDAKIEMLRKQQTPLAPYPYDEEEISIANKADQLSISGTLTTPRSSKPFAAVVIVQGGGRQNRDGNFPPKHQPYLVLADHITRNGIAVLRCDKRGTGDSTGNFKNATTEDFARDVTTCIDYLRDRPDIDRGAIGIVGHCEGAIVASIVAAKRKDISFIVLMASPGLPGDEFYLDLWKRYFRAQLTTRDAEARIQLLKKMNQLVISEKDRTKVEAEICSLFDSSGNTLTARDRASLRNWYLSPWFRYYISLDPIPILQRSQCPVLAIQGGMDAVVEPTANFVRLSNGLKTPDGRKVTLKLLPGLNHMFQPCQTPVEDGERIGETISPDALRVISAWIVENSKHSK